MNVHLLGLVAQEGVVSIPAEQPLLSAPPPTVRCPTSETKQSLGTASTEILLGRHRNLLLLSVQCTNCRETGSCDMLSSQISSWTSRVSRVHRKTNKGRVLFHLWCHVLLVFPVSKLPELRCVHTDHAFIACFGSDFFLENLPLEGCTCATRCK